VRVFLAPHQKRHVRLAPFDRGRVPSDWAVADKTGTGTQGEHNDVAVVWPPGRAPFVMAIYAAPIDHANPSTQDYLAEAAHVATSALIHR
jgi:beta-lactamase class A